MMMNDDCCGTVLPSLVIKLLLANLHDRCTNDNSESVISFDDAQRALLHLCRPLLSIPSNLSFPGRIELSLMCLDGTRRCNIIEMAHAPQEGNVLRSFRSNASHVDEVVRETEIEIISLVDLRHVLGSELKAESVDVGFEVTDFVTADRWEHVWGLGQILV